MKKRSKNKKSQNHETKFTLSDEVMGRLASREVVIVTTLFGRLEARAGVPFLVGASSDLITIVSS
jgi:hypothetical protein